MKDGYRLVGFQYEFTGSVYSLGRIPKCKTAMLKHLRPGDRVLVAGVGPVSYTHLTLPTIYSL